MHILLILDFIPKFERIKINFMNTSRPSNGK